MLSVITSDSKHICLEQTVLLNNGTTPLELQSNAEPWLANRLAQCKRLEQAIVNLIT